MKDKTKKLILVLCFITIACYANTLNAGFVWDDYNNIVNNDRLENNEGIQDIFLYPSGGYYRPFSYLSIRIDHFLWGKNPAGYHITNLIFHILNALVIFKVFQCLGLSERASFLAGLLFAVHPVHTEAVSYISGRSDVIAAFFIFLSFYFFIKGTRNKNYLNKNIFISLGVFLFALLSKEIALIYPVLILCFLFTLDDSKISIKLKYAAPFFIVGIIFLMFWQTSVNGELITPASFNGITNFFKIIIFYVTLLFLPVNLHMQRYISESAVIHSMPFFVSMVVFCLSLYVLKRAIKIKLFNFSCAWFIIGLFPFWGWLKYSAEVAEHWLYIPSLGFFLLVGYFAERVIDMKSKRIAKILKVSIYSIIVLLGILTFRQNRFWKDDLTLYKYTLKFNKNSTTLIYNLANAYLRNGKLNKAEETYYQVLRLKPDYAQALNNLAIVKEKKGQSKKALALYEMASKLNPSAFYARSNLDRLLGVENAFADDQQFKEFDHSLYGKLLTEHTKNGWVDYKRLKKDPTLLSQYIKSIANLSKAEFNKMSLNEKMALYINAYNAFTIKAIIDHYPVSSIKKIPGVWKKIKFTIAGERLTLDEIEHGILRPKYKDPRVHFALVCAARGCPRLNSIPFTAEKLNDMLEESGKSFLNDKTRNILDRKRNVLYLSSIFKWFKKDFGKDIIAYIGNYLNEQDYQYIKENRPKIKYQYDWSLNEKK